MNLLLGRDDSHEISSLLSVKKNKITKLKENKMPAVVVIGAFRIKVHLLIWSLWLMFPHFPSHS